MTFLQYSIITPDLERNADTKTERERETRVMHVRELPHPLVIIQFSVQFCAIISVLS